MTASWLAERLESDPVDRFLELARGATVIGVGESSHHTAQCPALRRDLLAGLVGQHRSLVVALEALPPGPNPIDDWVLGAGDGATDAAGALCAAGVRMWRNEETTGILELLRDANRSGSAVVRVRGIDVLTPGRLIRRVLARAPVLGLPLKDSVDLAVAARGLDQDGVQDQASFDSLGSVRQAALQQLLVTALIVLSRDEQRVRSELGSATYTALHRDAVVSLRALDALRAGSGNWTAGLPARDRAMAENVAALVRSEPAERYVVLSHNTHVAAAPAVDRNYAAMGTHLRRWFGRDYAAVGTTFGRARFDPPIYGVGAVPDPDGPAGPDSSTVDALLAGAGDRPAWLDLRAAGPALPVPLPLRGVGGESSYDLAAAFDALIHLPMLTSARQLVETDLGLALPPRAGRPQIGR